VKVSLPVPPKATVAKLMPRDSQPRVVSTAAMPSPAAMPPRPPATGAQPKTWPNWKSSFPAPPSSVISAELSSLMKLSSPSRPSSVTRPSMLRS
jgi:hypothetical protein